MPKKILIVEDDENIRDACEHVLKLWGHEPLTAEHGEAALRLMGLPESRPDLILLDVMMPRMTAEAFLERQQRHPDWRGIPVVVMSALDSVPAALSRFTFLRKPMDLLALKEAVRTLPASGETAPRQAACSL